MAFTPVKKVEEEFVPIKKVPVETSPRELREPTLSTHRATRGSGYGGPEPDPQKAAKQFGQWVRENPRMVGAGLGALRGARHGLPGAVGGAVLGGVFGEQVHQIDQLASKHPNMPTSTKESLLRQGKAGVVSAIEEVGGGITLKVANKVLAPFAKSVTPQAKIAIETLQKYMPGRKSAITTAEGTDHWMLDFAHNVATKSFFGGAPMAKHGVMRREAVENMVDGLANGFGKEADPVQLGNMVTDVISGNWKAYKEEFTRPLYNRVEQLTAPTVRKVPVFKSEPTGLFDANGKQLMREVQSGVEEVVEGGITADIRGLKKSVESNLRHLKNIKFVGKENSGDTMVLGISNLPDSIQVDTAIALRKRLIAISDELAITNKKDPAIGIANSLTKQLDNQIESALKSANPEALATWREANRLYKDGAGKYNNRFLRGLIKQADPVGGKGEPGKVLNTIFRNGGVDNINKVKTAVGKDAWNQLKGWHVREMLLKSAKPDGVIDGMRFKNQMFGSGGMRRDGMEAIYTPAEIKTLENNAITLGVIQAKQGGGAGGMLIQLAQAGAIAGIATGQFERASLGVLISPEVVARILTSKHANKWLLNTAQVGKRGVLVGSTALRLTNIAKKIEDEIAREREALSK
jgi:hypothetical protein